MATDGLPFVRGLIVVGGAPICISRKDGSVAENSTCSNAFFLVQFLRTRWITNISSRIQSHAGVEVGTDIRGRSRRAAQKKTYLNTDIDFDRKTWLRASL